MTPERAVCRLAELNEGEARRLERGLFAIRLIDGVVIYLNACPHLGVPLDWLPGRFWSADGKWLVCATHGAEFRPEDGVCLRGPCRGDRLQRVPSRVRDGIVYVPEDAGRDEGGAGTPA